MIKGELFAAYSCPLLVESSDSFLVFTVGFSNGVDTPTKAPL